jgi:hypothetical protein
VGEPEKHKVLTADKDLTLLNKKQANKQSNYKAVEC